MMDVSPNTAGNHSLALIFFPQATSSAKIAVQADGVTYESAIEFKKENGNPVVELNPGYSYIFNVKVCKTGLVINGANVSDWIPGNGNNGENVDANM